jgi:hypothetical protein
MILFERFPGAMRNASRAKRCLGGAALVHGAVGPQIGSAYAGGGYPEEGIRGLPDYGLVAVFEAHVMRTVKDGAQHGFSSQRPIRKRTHLKQAIATP